VVRPTLSSVQAVVAIAAGVITVLAGAYTLSSNLRSEPAGTGQVVAILRELPSEKPVNAATLEIWTPKNELVTMLTSSESGRVRYSLKEGSYRLRVSHPRFDAENRTIHVASGQTAEVRIEMKQSTGGSTPLGSTVQAVDEGVGKVKQFFKDLGF
jgi:hypothetical protein